MRHIDKNCRWRSPVGYDVSNVRLKVADIRRIEAGKYKVTLRELYTKVRAVDATIADSCCGHKRSHCRETRKRRFGAIEARADRLEPGTIGDVSDAIKAAHKAGPCPNLELETTVHDSGTSLIASDRIGAETFFKLSEMDAELREHWDKQGARNAEPGIAVTSMQDLGVSADQRSLAD